MWLEPNHTPQNVQKENCTLLVLHALKSGVGPSAIWKNLGISERSVKYALAKLKAAGAIRRVGYGTWEVLNDDVYTGEGAKHTPPEGATSHRVTMAHTPVKVQLEGAKRPPDSVRGHGIVATLKVPERFLNWRDRHIILAARKIQFIEIPQGQRIKVGRINKVWLTHKSIVFYFPPGYSWFGDNSRDVAGAILEDIIDHAKKLERMMGMDSLKVGGYYRVKVSRQHYSLIKNGLAKYYNNPRRKLEVRNESGIFLLIDNSFHLNETETPHPETAVEDNQIFQDWARSQQRTPLTSEDVTRLLGESAAQIKEAHGQLSMYAKNLETHVAAVNNLSNQAQENAKTTIDLREAVQRLSQSLQRPNIPADLMQRLPAKAIRRLEEKASEPIQVTQECGLCGKMTNMPPGKTWCEECDTAVSVFRKPTRDSSMSEFYDHEI